MGFRGWPHAVAALVLAALPGNALAFTEVGNVVVVELEAFGQIPPQDRRSLDPAASVYSDEWIETVVGGGTKLQFLDGSELAIGSGSRVVLDQFVYDPGSAGEPSAVELGTGAFRFLAGQLGGHAEDFEVRTPTATIGVRGTDFVVRVFPNGNTLVTESDAGRAFEVTPSGEIVWEFLSPWRAGEAGELVATLFEVVRLPPDFDTSWARPPTAERAR